MTKRANGEGSVFKLKDGTWRAACPGGRPSFRGNTRAEALRRRDAHMRSEAQIVAPAGKARDCFTVVISQWLEARRGSWRPRTVESYHETATKYVIPAIGDLPVGRLTSDDIARAMNLAESPRTKNYIRTVCHMALEWAVDNDIVPRNVARKVPTVTPAEHDRDMPSAERWGALLEATARERTCARALILVMVFGGLRVGEVLGLTWEDFDGLHLRIRRASDRAGNLAPVKTKAGRRTIPLGKRVIAALIEWREEQRVSDATSADDRIFTTRNGRPWDQRNVLRVAHRVTTAAGLGKRSAHYLRHVAISHLIADSEVDLKTVQTIAGHSSIRVTLDTYGHLIPGRLHKAAEAMDRKGKDD